MQFRILGPVEAEAAGAPLPLGGPRQRALLALLLLHANEVVARDVIVEALWPDSPGDAALRSLQVAVSSLRKALGDAGAIVAKAPGYLLEVAPDAVDAVQFERLAREGRVALESGEAPRAAGILDAALALWRGAALADVADEPFARIEAMRLDELRVEAREDRLAAALDIGDSVLAELEALVREHPYRERSRALLMLALYRAGRQADALDLYRETRALFVDQLGIEPGPELQQLERRILEQAPDLAPRRRSSLPVPPTPTVGRDVEIELVVELLRRGDSRVVTLTGPGGVGKTRLALESARQLEDAYDSVALVPLATVRDTALLMPALVQAVGVQTSPGESDLDALGRVLGGGSHLLLLDNLEQLADVATPLSQLLAAAAGLSLLATSRGALHVSGEQELPVEPLAVDPAVALFVQRARAVRPAFEPDAAVREICARLEGLPLAIELAAARTRVLVPEALLARLDSALPVLVGGARDLPERQQTLEAAIAWSYELLEEEERAAFARLSVFAGGWTIDAAELACDTSLELLESLVDKSLVRAAGDRFTMLATIREYASAQLDDASPWRDRHLDYFIGLATEAEVQLRGPEQSEWFEWLEQERANIRAALAHAVEAGRAEDALRLVGALRHFWAVRGPFSEARHMYEQALAGAPVVEPGVRERALTGLGIICGEQGDHAGARAAFEEALELTRLAGDVGRTSAAVSNLATLAFYAGDLGAALSGYEEALSLAQLSARERISTLAENLAVVHLIAGDNAAALRYARLSVSAGREAQDLRELAAGLRVLARVLVGEGDVAGGVAAIEESRELVDRVGDATGLAEWFEDAAAVAVAQGEHEHAASLLGAADAQRERKESAREPERATWYDEVEAAARAALGGDYDAAYARGRLDGPISSAG